ncbi:YveK family protein [Paenibacillus spongiae]|uniref:Wzz/FepE/Etk N-terminal domain-containing protein n=1 Tax=Paenibacillus spongiae TaxID=2909671 RepID=A0ABY5SFT7_9BACL|nr:Wzz/FepE/Etk N-terminal domain-containing protein [Paenibacillus spongiae]UVI31602.1 Wzz/FepE/Etk N-terminal domain-containing protein [Paenibacillus spongiae]
MELKQYLKIIRKKLWLIAAIVIIICTGTFIKSYYFTTPIYQANAKLIVNQTIMNDGLSVLNPGSIQTNIMLINSYKEIIKSTAILKKVNEKYPELKISPARISVTSANNSQIMDLTYSDESYKNAAKSVNAISSVFKEEIPSIMKVDNVTILNEAVETAINAEKGFPILNVMISFIISLMLAIGIIFLHDYLDNTYKTEDELEDDLGLPVLASVTMIKKGDRKRRKSLETHKVGDGTYASINQ